MARFLGSTWLAKAVALLLTTAPASSFARDNAAPAAELLAFFSASCPSQGEWTRAALGQAQALVTALQNLQDDTDCRTISGAIGELQQLSLKVRQLERVSQYQQNLASLQSKEQEILLQLGNTQDPTLHASLVTQLSTVQIALVGAQGAWEAQQEFSQPQQADLLGQVVSSTNSVVLQAVNNQRCLIKRPNLLPAIASLAGSIGSAVSSVNPALGLGIAAGTQLLGQTVEYYRKAPVARQIRRISDSMAGQAYQCVLESLSTQWCRADDAERVVKLKAEARVRPIAEGELVTAVRLLDREIPALLNWLEILRSGGKPANTADANRQQEVFDREARARSAVPIAIGILEQARPLFEATTDIKERWRVQRRAINDIFGLITPDSRFARNPLNDIYQEPFARYFLLGLDESEVPRTNSGVLGFDQFDPLTQWPRQGQLFSPSLVVVEAQVRIWAELARQRVSREMSLVLQPDALRTLSEAFDGSSNPWKVSARDSLRMVRGFLQERAPREFTASTFRRIYSDTIDRLRQVESQLDQVAAGPSQPTPAPNPLPDSDAAALNPEQQALAEIYSSMGLQYGSIYIRGRLEMAIRLALLELFRALPPAQQNVAAQVLASDRFLDVLQRVSGTDNLAVILSDIQGSKPITQDALQSFADVFSRNIRERLRYWIKQESKVGGSSGQVYRRARTSLCLNLLAVPAWPRGVPQELCSGLQLEPVIPGGPSSIVIDASAFALPHEKRACSYRDYLRLSKIYQDWNPASSR